MGALPKIKVSITRRRRKRAHYLRLKMPSIVHCSNCDKRCLSHRVCPHCGQYKRQQIITIKENKKKID